MSANAIIRNFATNQTESTFRAISTLDPEGDIRFYISDGGKIDLGRGLDVTVNCFLQKTNYPLSIEGSLHATSAGRLMKKEAVFGLNFQNPEDLFVRCNVTSLGLEMKDLALDPNMYINLACTFIGAIIDKKGYDHLQTLRSSKSFRLVHSYLAGTIDTNDPFYIWMNEIDPTRLSPEAYDIFIKYGCLKDATEEESGTSFFCNVVNYFTGKKYRSENRDVCQRGSNNVVTRKEQNITTIRSEGIGSIAAQNLSNCKVVNVSSLNRYDI